MELRGFQQRQEEFRFLVLLALDREIDDAGARRIIELIDEDSSLVDDYVDIAIFDATLTRLLNE